MNHPVFHSNKNMVFHVSRSTRGLIDHCQTLSAGLVVLVLNLLGTKIYNIHIWMTCWSQKFVLGVFWHATSPSLCFHHAFAIGTNCHFAQLGQNHICCSIHSWENYIYDGYTVMKLSYWQSTLTMLHSCYFLLVYPCCGNQPSLWPYILNEINLLMQEDVVGWHLIWLCHI